MIYAIQGKPGMGKTLWLVEKIIKFAQKKINVYTNIEIKWNKADPRSKYVAKINALSDLYKVKEGKVVLDEAQTYFSSRKWDSLDQRLQTLFQQHRKRGLDIIGASQSIKRCDVVYRELVQVFYDVKKIFAFSIRGNGYGMFILREYDPDYMEKDKDQWVLEGWPTIWWPDEEVFRLYDTTQEIELIDPVGRHEVLEYVHVKKEKIERMLLNKKFID